MEIMRELNEWWLSETGNLHIGETIISEDGCCTVSSHKYNYHKKDLKLVVHQPYCFVYSDKFPFLDVWECYKKKDGEQPTASISWTKRWSGRLPEDIKDKIYNVKKLHHYPYFVDDIEFPYILWKNGEKTRYDDTEVEFERTWKAFDKTHTSLKYSTCSRYVAAFFDSENIDDDDDDDDEYVDIFDTIEDKWLFRVNHNTYYRQHICKVVEFIDNNGHTYVLINDEHSVLSLYDMKGNVYKQFEDGDDFYTEYYKVIDDEKEWLVFYGFIWSPLPFMKIFDVQEMMNNDEYEPELYTNYLRSIDKNDNITKSSNKVCRFKDEYYTPTDYRNLVKKTEDEIENIYIAKLKALWKNENLFKKILKDQTVANIKYKNTEVKEKVGNLLSEEVTNGSCIGGNSGCKFRDNLMYMLSPLEDMWNDYKKVPTFIKGNQDTLIVDAIASTLMYPYKQYTNIIDNYEIKGTSLKVVNLIFSLVFDKMELEVNIKFNMMPMTEPDMFHFPNNDACVNVMIDIK